MLALMKRSSKVRAAAWIVLAPALCAFAVGAQAETAEGLMSCELTDPEHGQVSQVDIRYSFTSCGRLSVDVQENSQLLFSTHTRLDVLESDDGVWRFEGALSQNALIREKRFQTTMGLHGQQVVLNHIRDTRWEGELQNPRVSQGSGTLICEHSWDALATVFAWAEQLR